MLSHKIKEPFEDNIWWEEDTLFLRNDDDSVWAFTHAQIMSHKVEFQNDSVVVMEEIPMEKFETEKS